MRLFQSVTLTFSMYSSIPMPYVEWDEDSMKWVFCCFPLVGALVGAVMWLWLWLCSRFALGSQLTAVGGLLIPLWLTGGIHLDGLCDTCDALGSHQSRERKLEILKDSHIGAFGVMGCVVYILSLYGGLCAVEWTAAAMETVCLSFVLSRALSGLMAVSCRNARGSGLLFTFTGKHTSGVNRSIIVCLFAAISLFMILFSGKIAVCALGAMALVTAVYLRMAYREFGGITGDLEGWYLQLLELVAVLAVSVGERLL